MRPPPRPVRVASVRPKHVPVAVQSARGKGGREGARGEGSGGGILAVGRPIPVAVRRPTVVAGSAERFRERVRMRRRITLRRAMGVLVGVLLAAAIGWVVFFSPVLAFDVAEVKLEGLGTVVNAADVMAIVEPLDDTPLPRIDTLKLRRSVLAVSGVREVEVARVWPHGLRVTIVSREPVAAVPEGEGFVLLDIDGVQVGRTGEAPAGLPVITVPVGDDVRAMTAVLAVLHRLPPELAAQVAQASADSQDTVRLVLTDGAQVEWGSADQTALKARVLQTLRVAEASRGAAVFDVSAPTLPITRS